MLRDGVTHTADAALVTVGRLSRRTGQSIKAIRQYEGLGLIYSAGRSEAGYPLFDQSALWCTEVIERLRSLGLTIKEIEQPALANAHGCDKIGPQLAELLGYAERRLEARIHGHSTQDVAP
jgi:MerR family copper efflux transcriptional regulator